ncbi:hypothetical protein [Epibacterium ulvae]|uniref:hypothetical protein n=1 Tax=Epibacterium ulvae TaxID=1156985 RepID=UPI0024914692|nr:hypothetical protein [Epibacterium ulvae]
MFDAVVARKARLISIIDGVGKQPREDLITSTLFGTLRFLLPEARAKALRVICDNEFVGDVQIHLWPFFRGNGKSAEPDVVLEFNREGQRAYWIVEVKWGAALGEDQAEREILMVKSGSCRRGNIVEGKRNLVGYTLLGAEKKHQKTLEELELKYFQEHAIKNISWKATCDSLRQLADTEPDPGLIAWARLAADFLAGEPQGFVLGPWPEMKTPGECRFLFDDENNFQLKAVPAVIPTTYYFRETDDQH